MPEEQKVDYYMECVEPNKNTCKFYHIYTVKEGDRYVLVTHYGRIGKNGRSQRKLSSKNFWSVESSANSLKHEKLSKGYKMKAQAKKSVVKAKKKVKPKEVTKKSLKLERFTMILD